MITLLLPIVFSIILGNFLYKINFLNDDTIDSFKKVVINITLPAALFSAFSSIRFRIELLIIFASVFVSCFLLFILGKFIAKLLNINSKYFPFLLTGFEAGMIGYALFNAVYGIENVAYFGVIDVGQVSFVFFVLVPLLILENENIKGIEVIKKSLLIAIKNPVVWSIILGLLASIFKVYQFSEHSVYISIKNTLSFISTPTTFLICLVIGSGLKFSVHGMKLEIITSLIRVFLTMSIAFLLKQFVFIPLAMDEKYISALLILFILPGAYVLPAFITNASKEEINYVSNTLSISTLISLVGFAIIVFI